MSYRRGFTLIEMLVVIAILVILAGLLFPVINGARGKAKVAETRATMTTVEAAITGYKLTNNGLLPLDDGSWTSANGTERHSDLVDALATVDSDSFGTNGALLTNGSIRDAWGSQIRYRPFIAYPQGQALYDVNIDSYQLWSIGENKRDETADGDLETGDDETNWGQ